MLKKIAVIPMLLQVLCISSYDPFFFILSLSYNNEKWCIKSLESALMQDYSNWILYIVNDASTDTTGFLLENYIREHALENKVILINNPQRRLAVENFYYAIHQFCHDDWIVVTLDGDDWFTTPKALSRIAQEYRDESVWLTYGNFINYPSNVPNYLGTFSEEILNENSFRDHQWFSAHVRTFKGWLFKMIEHKDLFMHGKPIPAVPDLATMFPMLEMASQGHIRTINDILYAYNHHAGCEHRVFHDNTIMVCEKYVRSLTRYTPLKSTSAVPRNIARKKFSTKK